MNNSAILVLSFKTKMRTVFCFFLLSYLTSCSMQAQADFLRPLRWQNRVILLIAPSPQDDLYLQQTKVIHEDWAGYQDRDLKVFSVFPNQLLNDQQEKLSQNQLNWLKQQAFFNTNTFQFILIGKDGGQKLVADQVVSNVKLFSLIDGMPMRRAEMRRKKKG